MNTLVVLCIVLGVLASPICAGILEELREHERVCAAEYKISADILAQLKIAAEVRKAKPDQSIKCFGHCFFERTQILKNDTIDFELLVTVGVLFGRSEVEIRTHLETCKHLFVDVTDCDGAWKAYACLNSA